MRRAIAPLLATMVICAGCGSERPTTPSPTPLPTSQSPLLTSAGQPSTTLAGHVVFSRAGGAFGDETTFVLDLATGKEVTVDESPGCCPFVSRDGTRILVAVVDGDLVTTETLNLDGKRRTTKPMASSTLNLGPGPWSPDGTRTAFEVWDNADPTKAGIYLGDTDTARGLQRITSGRDVPADYSPDGSRLLFWRGPEPTESAPPVGVLMTVPTAGGTPTQVSPKGVGVPGFRADWSPDGHAIAFTDDTGSIWTVGSDGTAARKVWEASKEQYAWTPSWGPNGSEIIVALSPEPNPWSHPPNKLVLLDADGQNPRVVSQTPDHKRNPTWVAP